MLNPIENWVIKDPKTGRKTSDLPWTMASERREKDLEESSFWKFQTTIILVSENAWKRLMTWRLSSGTKTKKTHKICFHSNIPLFGYQRWWSSECVKEFFIPMQTERSAWCDLWSFNSMVLFNGVMSVT